MRALLVPSYVLFFSFLPWTSASPIGASTIVPEVESPSNYTSSPAMNNLVKRSEVYTGYCNNAQRANTLSVGYAEARLLAAPADRTLGDLDLYVNRSPPPTREQARQWNRPLIDTYEAIFGKLINEGQLRRENLKTLALRAKTMSLALQTNIWPKIEVQCDDDWVHEKEGLKPGEFWDDRPAMRGGQQAITLGDDGKCENEGYFAYTTTYKDEQLDVAVFCPPFFDEWGQNRLQDLANRPTLEAGYHIVRIERRYIGLTVLHELMHSENILASAAMGWVSLSPSARFQRSD
ncbi:hypothetical protein BDV12DRAFT_198754 [Aspergillus spectabilis]